MQYPFPCYTPDLCSKTQNSVLASVLGIHLQHCEPYLMYNGQPTCLKGEKPHRLVTWSVRAKLDAKAKLLEAAGDPKSDPEDEMPERSSGTTKDKKNSKAKINAKKISSHKNSNKSAAKATAAAGCMANSPEKKAT